VSENDPYSDRDFLKNDFNYQNIEYWIMLLVVIFLKWFIN